MGDHRRTAPTCFFAGWIVGWATAIYVPSALIALTNLSPVVQGRTLLSGIFEVADEVAPAAKISFAVIFAVLMFVARRLTISRGFVAIAVDMLLASTAMLLTLAILPPDWSRGFGIGLTGTRFAPDVTAIYMAGALLSGLVFSLSEARCSARTFSANGGSRSPPGDPS